MKSVKAFVLSISILIVTQLRADEGMWLPQLLQQLNEKQMISLGMKIKASDIYNINKGSLKDAVVSFGGFCTGELISDKGLVLTNHHCGFDAIQNHSTLDHNYLKDGFWARSTGEELPNPGLFVTFIVRIEEVTSTVLEGISANAPEAARQTAITNNLASLKRNYKLDADQEILIKPFYEGSRYFLFVTETYRDVRLVGAPPSSIGNFGKDTDNWMWPRHTGDFSMFRIYANKNNRPAAFSPDNIPYKPKRSLSISLDGVALNDFTMVFGFPGRTSEYLPASAVEQIVTVNDPLKIAVRERALAVIDSYMRKDEQLRIQYAEKYAGIENSYKKWKGEVLGMSRTNGLEKKKAYEQEFQKRLNANPALRNSYGNLLNDLDSAYKQLSPFGVARDYYAEVVGRIDLFVIASEMFRLSNQIASNSDSALVKLLPSAIERIEGIYKEYNPPVDKTLFTSLIEPFVKNQEPRFLAPELMAYVDLAHGNYSKMADMIYDATDLDDPGITIAAIKKNPRAFVAKMKKDRVMDLFSALAKHYNQSVVANLTPIQTGINLLQRQYMEAQIKAFPEKKFYPDANSTLRVTYGQVKGYEARDAIKYQPYTYLDGVMEKYVPGDYEFDVPQRLRDLYARRDYGQYGSGGKMPVCFLGTNHTTGGNSGSPVLDAYGNLVGLNFDRVWEGTMSDLNYDPAICRNIMVDIRYVLFLVDKFAGATNLIAEMKLVHPKKNKG